MGAQLSRFTIAKTQNGNQFILTAMDRAPARYTISPPNKQETRKFNDVRSQTLVCMIALQHQNEWDMYLPDPSRAY